MKIRARQLRQIIREELGRARARQIIKEVVEGQEPQTEEGRMKIQAKKLRNIIAEELGRARAQQIIREAAGGNAIDMVAACMDRIRGGRGDESEIDRCISELSARYPQGRDTIQKIDGQLRVLSHERRLMDDDIGSMNIERLQGAERQLPALAVQLMR